MSYIKHRAEESLEDYLETILILSKRNPYVRSIDIATELSYSKPSVSVAMKNLKANGMIMINDDGRIELTKDGLAIAEQVYEKHVILYDWLISLGINPDIAKEDACKMEHDISMESFEAIKKFILEKS